MQICSCFARVFRELRLAGEHGLAGGVHQFEGVDFGRATAALPVLVHAHPEGEVGPLVGIVRAIAGLDGMQRNALRLAGLVDVGDGRLGRVHAHETDRVRRALLERRGQFQRDRVKKRQRPAETVGLALAKDLGRKPGAWHSWGRRLRPGYTPRAHRPRFHRAIALSSRVG